MLGMDLGKGSIRGNVVVEMDSVESSALLDLVLKAAGLKTSDHSSSYHRSKEPDIATESQFSAAEQDWCVEWVMQWPNSS